jgi:hypothetical protein
MRNFNLDNKNSTLCDLNGNVAKFVFDGGALTESINKKRKKIEDALVKRNFDVEGVKIEFWHSVKDDGGKHIIRIANIVCDAVDIRIGSNYHIRVKGFDMSLHEDGSGALEVYCGQNWDKDREEFLTTKHFHRKMDGQSRIVLQYDKYSYDSNTFRATDDCNRGYLPTGSESEPMHYTLQDAESKIIDGLNELLDYINTFPEQTIDKNLFAEPMPVPLKNESAMKNVVLHTTISLNDKYRLEDTEDKSNHGISGGYRMLGLSMRLPEHKYADMMHEGFVYCELQYPGEEVTKNVWNGASMSERFPVTIKLANTNNVFVVDAHAADEFRDKWFKENPDADRMTNDAYNEMQTVRAMTMVHINDYEGTFKNPVVIIGRAIAKKEIKILKTVSV